MVSPRIGDFILTYVGGEFYPLDPRPQDISILDIAQSLSHQCRFTGHTKSFYSVAQHLVLVSTILPLEYAMYGLLHDASEAYLCDIASPIKKQPAMDFYRVAEDRLQRMIYQRFGLDPECPHEVHSADRQALALEARSFMEGHPCWEPLISELAPEERDVRLSSWDSEMARVQFLKRFYLLRADGWG